MVRPPSPKRFWRFFFFEGIGHGEARHPKDKVVVVGRNRIFLRHEEKSAHIYRKAGFQEI
jgi:hypothetical protein